MTVDLQPIVLALAALVVAITPVLVVRMTAKVNDVAASVDGATTALRDANAVLLARVEALHAAALTAAKAAPPVGTRQEGDRL